MSPHIVAEQLIKSVPQLPSAPKVMIKLANMLQDPNTSLDTLYDTLRQDTALTCALLSRCGNNTRNTHQVLTFEDAVRWMGFNEISRIAISHYAWQATRGFSTQEREIVENEWHHSIFSAIIASILARKLGTHETSAFTVGLLHDIGKLIMLAKDPEKFKTCQTMQGAELCAFEVTIFGVDHATLGAQLFLDWGLAPDMVEAVLTHHLNHQHNKLGSILIVANALATGNRNKTVAKSLQEPACVQALDELKLNEQDLVNLEPEIRQDIQKYGAII